VKRFLRKAAWYRNRLASMSAAEIRHRAIEQVKRAVDRHTDFNVSLSSAPMGGIARLPGLAGGLSALANDLALREQWREIARRAASGDLHLLGADWPRSPVERRWHLDPVTGGTWPADAYCFDIPYRRAEHLGDVKYVWELNRLQYLQPIAALAAIENDADLTRACVGDVVSWIDANPPFKGVNWASGIELGLRVVSLLVVVSLVGEQAWTGAERDKLWRTLAAHGYWLRRYPSRFSSANNHCIAEAGALYLLGALAPTLPGAGDWATVGRATLIDEVQRQIHDDGVGAEQSPTYTAFTLEWLLLCGATARRLGIPFPTVYWERIARAAEFLRWITDAEGGQPRIGDDDEGRVFFSQLDAESYTSSVLGCIAASLERPDLSPPHRLPHLREAFFGQPPAAVAAPVGLRHFTAGGYTVARSMHGGAAALLVVDHGPLGYLSIAAHGHADALALWLHIDSQPVLVDAGTFLYHSGGSWRDHFRGTPAHNTLSIRGADSSCIAGAFNWSRKAVTRVVDFDGNPKHWWVVAEHDGYLRDFGLRHRRRVEQTGADSFQITDELQGSGGEQPVEIGFLFHPALEIDNADGPWTVRKSGRTLLTIEGDGQLAARLQIGQTEPPRGWYSEAFGHKAPACRLVFHGQLAVGMPCSFSLRLLSPR
jgi:uncharacterized heparinase superfamily protein